MKIRPVEGNEREFTIEGVWDDGDLSPRRMLLGRKPVVILNPEDRPSVVRLMNLMWRTARLTGVPAIEVGATEMQAALREFADPKLPRPEEPTGLGAVVEDADGRLWTRVERADDEYPTRNPWYPADDADMQPDEYRHIGVVRVLSEGIS